MYEDSTNMNSEQTNRNSRLALASASEIKNKTSDSGVVAKLSARNSKKREGANVNCSVGVGVAPAGAGCSGGNKNQKSFQPKSKGLDKRQKWQSRGGFSGHGTHRKNDYEVVDSVDPDLDSIVPESGKKQNLAHLLNMKFQLAPRESSAPYWRATHLDGGGSKAKKYSYYSGRGHYNKDNYLQANCQFVVKSDGDYSVYLADPDLLVQWECIEQIRIWGSEVGSCPICLHPPVAARISRCGHIYCWPCVLHFLALSDKPSRPCPICDAPIKMQDLKSVVALEHQQFKLGDLLEFKLMKRDRHSLQPVPVHHEQMGAGVSCGSPSRLTYLQTAGENQVYSKLLLATPRDVIDLILNLEKKDLLDQWENEKDCPEACFIQQALDLLAARESAASTTQEIRTTLESGLEAAAAVEVGYALADLELNPTSSSSRSRYASDSSESCLDHVLVDDSDRVSSSPPTRNPPSQQKNVFYFYQSSDGQTIYLHPLNVQMLVRQYGSLELCPEAIQGHILEKETMSMTEELRNRLRYLGHLPLCSQFQVVEIALEEPIVSQRVIEEFRERINERERRRRRKDREERRRDIEIQRAEEAKWGRSKNQPIVRLDSEVHFPGFSPTSTELDPPLSLPGADGIESSPPEDEPRPTQQTPGLSFAQMLRQGKSKPVSWPSISSPSVPEASTSCWGRPNRIRTESENDPDCQDYAPVPEFRETFSSALSAAFDRAAQAMDGRSCPDAENGGENKSTKRRKKKSKQKILFATGMNFI